MSREDYISKLFRKNASKLESKPSDDLWGRIEQQLDATAPTLNKGQTKVLSIGQYVAAASVLLVVCAGAWFMTKVPDQALTDVPEQLSPIEDVVLTMPDAEDGVEPLTLKVEAEEQYEREDEAQSDKIVEIAKKSLPKPEMKAKLSIEAIDIPDHKDEEEITLVAEEDEDMPSVQVVEDIKEQPVPVSSASEMHYAMPQGINTVQREEVLSTIKDVEVKREALAPAKQNTTAAKSAAKSKMKSKGRGLSLNLFKSKKRKSSRKERGVKHTMHRRLQLFTFLVGKFEDRNESDGIGFEVWSVKDPNTLYGQGYKTSEEGDRLFAEQMEIRYEAALNQVFLKVSFIENGPKVSYLLTNYDVERLVFVQEEQGRFPSEITLLRERNGFTWTLSDSRNALSSDIQRYLDNRNRVSNVKATRTLSPVE